MVPGTPKPGLRMGPVNGQQNPTEAVALGQLTVGTPEDILKHQATGNIPAHDSQAALPSDGC